MLFWYRLGNMGAEKIIRTPMPAVKDAEMPETQTCEFILFTDDGM